MFMVAAMLLVGCSGGSTTVYELPYYGGEEYDELHDSPVYNKELWQLNNMDVQLPDPFVLDNTARDGYYYVYGTSGLFACYRSKDLAVWENVGEVLTVPSSFSSANSFWAPEVTYDADTEKYYLFFSAHPQGDTVYGSKVMPGNVEYLMMAAQSSSPGGPYTFIDFTDAADCGESAVHTYDRAMFPHYYAKYAYLDPQLHYAKISEVAPDLYQEGSGGYMSNIDAHPYTDPSTGKKYLYFIKNNPYGSIIVVEMKEGNWLRPDWDTYTVLTRTYYYTVEDYQKAQAGETVETVPYERTGGSAVNEGPTLYRHNDIYYLNYSTNGYGDSTYCVAQAVSDSPLGPFRKLREEENGVVLSADLGMNPKVSGSGHNSLIEYGGKLYMSYHKHNDVAVGGDARHMCIDEIKWISITDKDGNALDVMYSVPTTTIQPKIYSEYSNVASQASVSLADGSLAESSLDPLTDGLLSFYKSTDIDFMDGYVKETRFSTRATVRLDFGDARNVRAVMIYNSKNETEVFYSVDEVRLVCEEKGAEKIYVIRNLAFDLERFATVTTLPDGSVYVRRLVPGAAAYAEFDDLNVKSIDVTVSVPQGQDCVAISEIAVLGK